MNGYGLLRTITDMARRALETVSGPLSLVGHSMGARVALEAFRLAPERIERIALLSTGIHPVRPGEASRPGTVYATSGRRRASTRWSTSGCLRWSRPSARTMRP